MSETYVTVQGWVGSKPQFKEVGGRTPQVSFRIGSTPRQLKESGTWSDRPTNWFNVECWRALAQNTFESVRLGQPVIVTGRLRTHEWTTDTGERRARVVLEALSVGHDLSKGTTTFTKSIPKADTPWPDSYPNTPTTLPSDNTASGHPSPNAPADPQPINTPADPLAPAASLTAPDPDLVAPFPPDEFSTTTLPLTPTPREAEAA